MLLGSIIDLNILVSQIAKYKQNIYKIYNAFYTRMIEI